MIDDDLLQEALDARAEGAPDRLADAARALALAHPRRTGWRGRLERDGRGGMTFAASSVALVLVLGVMLVVGPGRLNGPSGPVRPSGTSDTPGTTASATAGTTAPDRTVRPTPAAWTALTWSAGDSAPFDVAGSNTYVQDATAWHGRWVAVGYSILVPDGTVAGRIWTSPDGARWTRQDGDWANVVFDHVIGEPDGITIVGAHRAPDVGDVAGAQTGAMWTSGDGHAWTEVALPAPEFGDRSIRDVAVGGRGWLVRTGSLDGSERTLLGSLDGGWRVAAMDPTTFTGAAIDAFIGTDGGWLAVGRTGVDPGEPNGLNGGDVTNDRGAIWYSIDGEHWTPAAVDQPGTSIDRVVGVAGGWIAIGTDHGGCPRCVGHPTLVWSSAEGNAWSPVPDFASVHPNSLGGLLVASDGLRAVAFDTDDGGLVRARQTTDGHTWSEVRTMLTASMAPDSLFRLFHPVVGPDTVVAFEHVSPPDSRDHVWVVPYVAVPGVPPTGAATQAPLPITTDTPCLPAGSECGP